MDPKSAMAPNTEPGFIVAVFPRVGPKGQSYYFTVLLYIQYISKDLR